MTVYLLPLPNSERFEAAVLAPDPQPTFSAAYHVLRSDPATTADSMAILLGDQAFGRALDEEIAARELLRPIAVTFWRRVCMALIQLRLAGEDLDDADAA